MRAKADYRSAIRIFNELISARRSIPTTTCSAASVYQTIGEADRAILDFSDAIRLAPRETYPLINRGVVLYTRKDNNEGAIADLTAALKLKPCEISAWINRGIVQRKKGELDKAIGDFTDGHQVPAAQDRTGARNRVPMRCTSAAIDKPAERGA